MAFTVKLLSAITDLVGLTQEIQPLLVCFLTLLQRSPTSSLSAIASVTSHLPQGGIPKNEGFLVRISGSHSLHIGRN
jgi:hypothetical protein